MTGALRMAVVGCGRMGTQRARALHALGVLPVLYDADRGRAEALAAEFPDGTVELGQGGVDWDRVAAVFVCTPPVARGPVEIAAAGAGVAVFVEKPIGLSAGHVSPVRDALSASGVPNAAGYMNRYRESVALLRERLAGHDVFAVHASWVGNAYAKSWWTDPALSGGPFNDQGSHLIDLCRCLVGEVDEVTAVGRAACERPDVADVVAVALRFETGACGTLLWSYRAQDKHVAMRFFSALGCDALEGWDFRPPAEAGAPRSVESAPITPVFLEETKAFVAAVRGEDPGAIRCTFADAYRTQLVGDAVRRSIESGRTERVTALDAAPAFTEV